MCKIVKQQIKENMVINEKITRENKEILNKYYEKVFRFSYDKRVIKTVNEDCIDTHSSAGTVIKNQSPDRTRHSCSFQSVYQLSFRFIDHGFMLH